MLSGMTSRLASRRPRRYCTSISAVNSDSVYLACVTQDGVAAHAPRHRILKVVVLHVDHGLAGDGILGGGLAVCGTWAATLRCCGIPAARSSTMGSVPSCAAIACARERRPTICSRAPLHRRRATGPSQGCCQAGTWCAAGRDDVICATSTCLLRRAHEAVDGGGGGVAGPGGGVLEPVRHPSAVHNHHAPATHISV